MGDYTLGQIVDRGRPLAALNDSFAAFPSGHVFGSTVFFGFIVFLAVHYQLKKNLLIVLMLVSAALLLFVGPARVYEQAHWPTDVAAGYLLGGLWLLVIIPAFVFIRGTRWMTSSKQSAAQLPDDCSDCQIARSIASVVVLNPEQGTATKVYTPPPVVRLLYWLAFQAKFPYETNAAALQAGKYRRQIGSALTIHRFGKDLVSPVISVDRDQGKFRFVTEFVPGELAKNDAAAQAFLKEVSESFAEAGLSVWQVNPRNPHAHTNLILTAEGDFKIIDLESAVVSLLPAPGQLRSSLKSGNLPVFDDIDFPRLRNYIIANEAALEASLTPEGLTKLRHATDHAEESITAWKNAEPRIWGHIISQVYKLLDWKSYFQRVRATMEGAPRAAELFLNSGIDRWEKDGRLAPSEAADLRDRLDSREAQNATRHLGAHLVLSVAIALPIPGARSLARFLWTLAFFVKAQFTQFRRGSMGTADREANIHTPLVMVLALVPGLGGVAYLASSPLRNKLLVRLMLDQVAWKLPFRLYRRMHLGRLLAPPAAKVGLAH